MQHLCSVLVVFCAVLAVATADYREDALNLHNQYRKKHNSPPLALSDKVNPNKLSPSIGIKIKIRQKTTLYEDQPES